MSAERSPLGRLAVGALCNSKTGPSFAPSIGVASHFALVELGQPWDWTDFETGFRERDFEILDFFLDFVVFGLNEPCELDRAVCDARE